jgi:TonB-linked SusC/RagA family outer membrane protein
MKNILLFIILLSVSLSHSQAQDREIRGTVTSSDEELPLPGVSILLLGTTTGTITDAAGNYRIMVSSGATLRYSYVGYASQEIIVRNQSIIDISLIPDISQLQEIIVTSLGIERQVKALGYSITEVDGEQFREARENNLANQLQGRVAGVNVTSVSSGPAASARVIIRGNSSLLGDNQPLYVVDGIPIMNQHFGQAGMWGGADKGDGMSSINPDDVESIEVLKGANAAALYGARAANGVINITTKKGANRKGIGVEFLSNYVFETVYDQRDYQREYGQGGYVVSDPLDPESPRIAVAPRTQEEAYGWGTSSWGPRLGSVATAIQFDGVSRPYTDAGDNWDRFYQTGNTWTNTLVFTGGNEKQKFRLSVSDLRNNDILPNTGFKRQNLSFSTTSKFGEKITITAKVLYSREKANNRPRVSDSPGNAVLAMHYIPANVNVYDYKGDPDKLGAIPPDAPASSLSIWGKSVGMEYQQARNNWHQNPWWAAYQYDFDDFKNRVITSGQLRYDITDFLYIQGRIGLDWLARRETILLPEGTGYNLAGYLYDYQRNRSEINMDYQIGFVDDFGPISINAFFGGNLMHQEMETLTLAGEGFSVPFFEALNNTTSRGWGYNQIESGINSLFGQAEIGYKGFLYLTATVRNDWFSVLNPEYNSILYPSAGLSFVFTDIINTLPSWLSFGKIRGSWAQVGNVTILPYETNLTYELLADTHGGYSMASFSSAKGVNGLIPNPELQPLLSTEIEFGIDIRFVDNRLGLDFTYYDQKTTDDIMQAQISRTTGFGRTNVNLGELTNKGFEVLLNGTPLRGVFNWDISLNFARNTNEVVKLTEEVDELTIAQPRNRNVFVKHIEGQPFGAITGRVQRVSPDGQPVFFADGRMDATTDFVVIGNGNPDWTGGLNNALNWKNWDLSFLIDFKIGGDIISGTNMRMTEAGLHKQTLIGREDQPPITISGVTQTGTDSNGDPIFEPIEKTLTPAEAEAYWDSSQSDNEGITDMYIYDASFAKLRQIAFGYSFPQKLLSKTPFIDVSLSFVGRNLFVLWKNIDNVDPESSYNNLNAQGLEYFGYPAVRSYGFNLKVGF